MGLLMGQACALQARWRGSIPRSSTMSVRSANLILRKVAVGLAAYISVVRLVVRIPPLRAGTWVRLPYDVGNRFCVRGRAAEALVFQTSLEGFDSLRTLLVYVGGS